MPTKFTFCSIVLLAISFSAPALTAQNDRSKLRYPVVSSVNGKLGYIDVNGRLAIPYKLPIETDSPYSTLPLANFRKGFAYINNSYYINQAGDEVTPSEELYKYDLKIYCTGEVEGCGFTDKAGKVVVKPQYTEVRDFSGDFAAVSIKGKWGFINRTGVRITEPIYKDLGEFSEGLARVKLKRGRLGFIDTTGALVLSTTFLFSVSSGRITPIGRLGYRCREAGEAFYTTGFSEGLYPVKVGRKWGFINKTGKIVIKPSFDAVQSFSEGVAEVRIGANYYFIDKKGKNLFKRFFKYAGPFSDGLALVYLRWFKKEKLCESDEKITYGYVDKKGNLVFVGNYNFWIQFAGDASVDLPSVVDLEITSDPVGASVFLVPFDVWDTTDLSNLNYEDFKQPANTNRTFQVQQQVYMIILKYSGKKDWKVKLSVTDKKTNFISAHLEN